MTTGSNGKIALVTGASAGIGEAICRSLVAKGHRVVASGRNRTKLDALAGELGEALAPLVLDVTDAAAVANLTGNLPAGFERIDILINNAGHDTGGRRRFDEGSADQWCDIVETNVQGLIRVTRALIDGMLERGDGHIINLGSIAGLKPYATGTAYVTSKYAVHGLSETLRLDYAGRGIRVTEIMPGLVRSGFAEQRLGDAEAAREFYDSFAACLQPQDVAETVAFAIAQPRHVEIAQLVVLPAS
ncbi:MAG: SDR family oxidoreductase [Gammaproteobacteria bacterium]|nr:MAG: SDR family oxidoreductase [Gammaproteobacteria bacterium]